MAFSILVMCHYLKHHFLELQNIENIPILHTEIITILHVENIAILYNEIIKILQLKCSEIIQLYNIYYCGIESFKIKGGRIILCLNLAMFL